MTNETGHNEVELCGTAASQPALSHENHGVQFYRFLLQIPRLSGQADTLPILLPSSLLPQIVPDAMLHVCGQLRSFNNKTGEGSRLVLTVYAMTFRKPKRSAANITPMGLPLARIAMPMPREPMELLKSCSSMSRPEIPGILISLIITSVSDS